MPVRLLSYYSLFYLCSVLSVSRCLQNKDVMRSSFQKAELLILDVMQQMQLRKEGQQQGADWKGWSNQIEGGVPADPRAVHLGDAMGSACLRDDLLFRPGVFASHFGNALSLGAE